MILDALVIDDEPLARRRLMRLLQAHAKTIQVVAEARDGVEALALIDEHTPDVLFLDVEMPGMSGLELAQNLDAQPLIVFTTAHDRFALAAFKENTIDYLLKPVSGEDLARAIRKLQRRTEPSSTLRPPFPAPDNRNDLPCLEHILVSDRATLRPVPIGQIIYFEARDKNTMVHAESGDYEVEASLATLEPRLPSRQFLRSHRRHLVNVTFITELRRLQNRQLQVILCVATKEPLIVSRRCVDDVMTRLGNLG